MNETRDGTRRGLLMAFAVAGLLAAIYLAATFWRTVSAFRVGRTQWASDLAREAGPAGVIWLLLAAGCVTLIATLLARRVSVSLLLVVGLLVGCVGLESSAIVERLKVRRMVATMTNLRDAGRKILAGSSSMDGLPLDPPPQLVAESVFRDGWGHPLRYVRIAPNHAFLIAPGSDGRIEANLETVKREVFPPSRFEHDIIAESVGGEFSFTVYPDGPAQGIPCAIYSAFGCLSYGR